MKEVKQKKVENKKEGSGNPAKASPAVCPCTRNGCERHGNCEECLAHHHGNSKKPLTRCEKLKQKELKRREKEECRAERKRRRGER